MKRKPQTVRKIMDGLVEHHNRDPLCGGWVYCQCHLADAIRALGRFLEIHDPKMTGKV